MLCAVPVTTENTQALATSLSRCAAPGSSPTHTVLAPIASNTGATASRRSVGPAASTVSCALLGGLAGAQHRRVDEPHPVRAGELGQLGGAVEADRAGLRPHRALGQRRRARLPITSATDAASNSIVTTTAAPAHRVLGLLGDA